MPVAEFPFPGPRRVPGPRAYPHPAHGSAPTLEELLLEAATLRPPHPDTVSPQDQEAIANIVNNPSFVNLPPNAMARQAANLGLATGAAGVIPELGNNVYRELIRALLERLDAEAATQPTIARSLTSEAGSPSIIDMMTASPNRSPFSQAFGPDPTSDLEGSMLQARTMQQRLMQMEPEMLAGERSAIEEESVGQGLEANPSLDLVIHQATPGSSAGVEYNQLLEELLVLLQAAKEGPSPETAIRVSDMLSTSSLKDSAIGRAIVDAIRGSGTGASALSPNAQALGDPISRYTMAPALDPAVVRRGLTYQGQNDPEMIMRLMGLLSGPQPRSNV